MSFFSFVPGYRLLFMCKYVLYNVTHYNFSFRANMMDVLHFSLVGIISWWIRHILHLWHFPVSRIHQFVFVILSWYWNASSLICYFPWQHAAIISLYLWYPWESEHGLEYRWFIFLWVPSVYESSEVSAKWTICYIVHLLPVLSVNVFSHVFVKMDYMLHGSPSFKS